MTNKLYNSEYLARMRTFFQRTKARSYELLQPQENDFIVDVGCGTGEDVLVIAQSGAKIVGVDHDAGYIETATQQAHPKNASFICCEAAQIPIEENLVDKIRFDRVLQHIENHDAVLSAVHRMLKEGGQLQIIDPDYLSWALFLEDWEFEQKILRSLAYRRIPHAHKFRELPKKLAQHGFKVELIEVHNYQLKDFDAANYIIKFDCIVEDESKRNNVSTTEAAVWERYKNTPAGLFNLSMNLGLIVARKLPSNAIGRLA